MQWDETPDAWEKLFSCNGVVVVVVVFFFNLNQKETKIKKQTNKKLKSSAISYPGKLGTRLKCVGVKSQDPTLNFIFR